MWFKFPIRIEEARKAVEQWGEDYNNWRPHSGLGNETPSEFAKRSEEAEDDF